MTVDDRSGRVRGLAGLYADDHGVKVRNWPFRARRFDWAEVSHFEDGSWADGQGGRHWALDIVLHTGRRVSVPGRPTPETLAAVRQVAARYGKSAGLVGVMPQPLVGVAPKRLWRAKDYR